MHVLLVRSVPGNDRFGLGPFFRIEQLGLEYIAGRSRGAGIARMHALETDEVLLAESDRRAPPVRANREPLSD
jgi:hypothetical protein